jgi:membrane associated rhomboid family serine protease
MYEVPVTAGDEKAIHVDVCRACQFVWFDSEELMALPEAPAPKPERATTEPLSPEAREQAAMAKLHVDDLRRRQAEAGAEPLDQGWKILPGLLGLPVEHEVEPIRCWPWATWGLAASLVLVFLLTVSDLERTVAQWGLIPDETLRHGGLTLITSFFLHAGWMHLIGNVYFLVVFGDNVEDRVGTVRYVLLILLAALVGDFAHIASDPHSQTPAVGASGGISGIIAFYALRFPRARIGLMFRYWWVFRWLYMPAYAALILWAVLQIFLAYQQLAGVGHVAAFAHLGGAVAGVVAWATWRDI